MEKIVLGQRLYINIRRKETMMFECFKCWLAKFRSETGVTTVEYAIMLALVAVAVALATPGISDAVTSVFDEAVTAMSSGGGT